MRASHVILRVRDMDRALAFYRDQVGLPVLMESAEFSFLDAGAIRIALNVVDDLPADHSLTEIVMEAEDLRLAHAEMMGRGIAFEVAPRVVTTDGTRSLVATHFHDPDGHLISLTGWE